MDIKREDAAIRSRKIIGHFQGLDHEFEMLKGVLCAYHGFNYDETQAFRDLIDTSLIAERMDELQKKAALALNSARIAIKEEMNPCTPAQAERANGGTWLK